MKGKFEWAAKKEDNNDNPLLKLLKSDKKILIRQSLSLLPGKLMYKRFDNMTKNKKHQSIVSSVEFHPKKDIAFTVGLDKKLQLFKVEQVSTLI